VQSSLIKLEPSLLVLYKCIQQYTQSNAGKPMVTETHIMSPKYNEKQFYQLVGSAEMGSEHPLAHAIVQHAKTIKQVVLLSPSKFEVWKHVQLF
jgi:hypothetical protein